MNQRVLFVSGRILLLRAISLLLLGQVVFVAWLLSQAPRSEWTHVLGERFWWAAPTGLLGISMVLPAAMMWLNNRYVLKLEVDDGTATVTTFQLWGRRVRSIRRTELASAHTSVTPPNAWNEVTQVRNATALRVRIPRLGLDLLFDHHGAFPEGEAAVEELFGVHEPSTRSR